MMNIDLIELQKGCKATCVVIQNEDIEKLEKEKENMQKELSRARGMISNKAFVEKAPVTLVEKEKEKITKYTELIAKIDMRISELKK